MEMITNSRDLQRKFELAAAALRFAPEKEKKTSGESSNLKVRKASTKPNRGTTNGVGKREDATLTQHLHSERDLWRQLPRPLTFRSNFPHCFAKFSKDKSRQP